MMFPINTVSKDGSVIIVYTGHSVAFARYQKPSPGRRAGWHLNTEWHQGMAAHFQKNLAGNGLAEWDPFSGAPHPGWDFCAWSPIPERLRVRVKMGRREFRQVLDGAA